MKALTFRYTNLILYLKLAKNNVAKMRHGSTSALIRNQSMHGSCSSKLITAKASRKSNNQGVL